MAENQDNNNLDDLLNDIALEPDNNGDNATIPVNEENLTQDEFHDDALNIEADDNSLEIDESEINEEEGDDDLADVLEDDKEYAVQKKQTKLQKILIGIVVGLLIVIIVGLIAYFLGFFDPEEPKMKEEPKKVEIKEKKKADFNFKDKDINVDRLNKKLNMLTKYEIIEDAKKEELKALEKEKLHQEAQRKLEEERLAKINRIKELEEKRLKEEEDARKREQALLDGNQNINNEVQDVEVKIEEPKEEVITVTKENKDLTVSYEVEPKQPQVQIEELEEPMVPQVEVVQVEEPMKEAEVVVEMEMPTPTMEQIEEVIEEKQEEEMLDNSFVKFIVITTNKKDIYKKDLNKITSVDQNIKLCRDDSNNIEIFVGPYDMQTREIKMAVFKYALKNQMVEALDFTQEEFDKRCNY